jgi:hypothetical protein
VKNKRFMTKINDIIAKHKQSLEQSSVLYDIQRVYDNNKKGYPVLLFPKLFEDKIYKHSELLNWGCKRKPPTMPIYPERPKEPSKYYKNIPTQHVKYKGVGCFYSWLIFFGGFFMFIGESSKQPILKLLSLAGVIFGLHYIYTRYPSEDKYAKYSDTEFESLRRSRDLECESEYEKAIAKYRSELGVYPKKEMEYQKEIELYRNRYTE